ncbi:MAG: hypothetical protein QOH56_878 [Pseudonocardiales bacterium]|jgi:hypothetical protein|nr:hypothetical protein [Pseudonocardiales bacterium]
MTPDDWVAIMALGGLPLFIAINWNLKQMVFYYQGRRDVSLHIGLF